MLSNRLDYSRHTPSIIELIVLFQFTYLRNTIILPTLHNLHSPKNRLMLVSLGFPSGTAASEETEGNLDEDDEADDEDYEDEANDVQEVVLHPGELQGGGPGDDHGCELGGRDWDGNGVEEG